MPVPDAVAPLEQGSPAPAASTNPAAAKVKIPGGPLDSWTFMASPAVLGCYQGEIVPLLTKAYNTTGMMGNGRSLENGGANFIANMRNLGFVEIPHDFPVTAWDKKRDPAQGSTYVNRYVSGGVVFHRDAWHRPKVLGHRTDWLFDAKGWLQFLIDVRKLIAPELSSVQVEIATEGLVKEIRKLRQRPDAHGQSQLEARLAHLPAQYAPPDLRDLLPKSAAKK